MKTNSKQNKNLIKFCETNAHNLQKLLLLLLLFCLSFNGVSIAQTCCLTNSLIINTGYDPTTGSAITPGCNLCTPVNDPKWQISYLSPEMIADGVPAGATLQTAGNAADVVDAYGSWVTNPSSPGAQGNWINCVNANYCLTTDVGSVYAFYVTFSRTFTLCTADDITLNLNIANDNMINNGPNVLGNVGLYVDAPSSMWYDVDADPSNQTAYTNVVRTMHLGAGTHTIYINVINYNNVPSYMYNETGLNVYGTVASATGTNSIVSESTACSSYSCGSPTFITGPTYVCVGGTITLADPVTGGVWTSGATGIATIDPSTGVLTGVSSGVVTISYALPGGGCVMTTNITVGGAPITGTTVLCAGTTTNLYDATGGGTWTSAATSVATIDASSGLLTGVGGGTALISYSSSCGVVTTTVTVNAVPPITGPTSVCLGYYSYIILGDADLGVWSSSNPAVATIYPTAPVVIPVSAGSTVITFTDFNLCTTTTTVNVGGGPITGPSSICMGSTVTLTDADGSGTWSDDGLGIATVDPVTGVVTGNATGTATITYTDTYGCTPATYTVNVILCCATSSLIINTGYDPASGAAVLSGYDPKWIIQYLSPDIYGAVPYGCTLQTPSQPADVVTRYSDWVANPATPGDQGGWINCVNANYYATTDTGTYWVTYSRSFTLCKDDYINVDLNVAADNMASNNYLPVPSGSGVWIDTDPSYWNEPVPWLSNLTMFTNVSNTVYLTSGTHTLYVNVLNYPIGIPLNYTGLDVYGTVSSATGTNSIVAESPLCSLYSCTSDYISGLNYVCVGSTITLTDASPGGTWTSANTAIATIDAASGVLTGVSSGVVQITYTLTTGYYYTMDVTVGGSPITGTTVLCVGSVSTLSDLVTGGTWTSSTPAVGTVDAVTGAVTGVAQGTTVITYTSSCGVVTTTVTVNSLPPVSGPAYICPGGFGGSYTDADPGVWSSTSPLVAIGSGTGIITGITAGAAVVTFTDLNGCASTFTVNVVPTAGTITGPTTVCSGSSISLSDPYIGGTWTSSSLTNATVGSTGVVTGVNSGTVNISYSLSGACSSTPVYPVTVLSDPITGPNAVCPGSSISLGEADAGGTWSSGSPLVATVNHVTGVVHGVSAGTAVISYTSLTGCIITTTIDVQVPLATCVCSYTSGGMIFSNLDPGGTGRLTVSPLPGNYFVNANITVQTNVNLVNCVIAMAPGTSITVAPGANLMAASSHLFSCSGTMWQGIEVQGGGTLTLMNNTLIEDAMVGVKYDNPITPGTYNPGMMTSLLLNANGVVFNQNITGIEVSNYNDPLMPLTPDNPTACYPFLIENTVFTSRDFTHYSQTYAALLPTSWPFKWPGSLPSDAVTFPYTPSSIYEPPYNIDNPAACAAPVSAYTMAVCNNGNPAQQGILLNNVGFTMGSGIPLYFSGMYVGNPMTGVHNPMLNLFDNLQYGVYASNSNVTVRNSVFQHMYNTGAGGDGIYAINDYTSLLVPNHEYKLYAYGSGTPSYSNWFYDCVNDVEAHEYYSVKAEYNIMSSAHVTSGYGTDPQGQNGVLLQSSSYYDVQLNYNRITNMVNGISHTATAPPLGVAPMYGQVTVTNNQINAAAGGGVPGLNEYLVQGVQLNKTSGGYVGVTWPGTEINADNNTLNYVYNGIYVAGFQSGLQPVTSDYNNIILSQDGITPMRLTAPQTAIWHEHISPGAGLPQSDIVIGNTITGPGAGIPVPPTSGTYVAAYPIMEGIHENDIALGETGCNTVNDLNTAFYFGPMDCNVAWQNNNMTDEAYGLILNAHIGEQLPGGVPCGDQWLGTWSSLYFQTYVINADPTLSPLNVSTAGPTLNGLDPSSSYTAYGPGSINTVTGAAPGCVAPVPPSVTSRHAGQNQPGKTLQGDAGSFFLFPNPNDGVFTLQGTLSSRSVLTQVPFDVVDLLGQVIYTGSAPVANGSVRVNITMAGNIANGVYMVRVRADDASQVIRFTLNR